MKNPRLNLLIFILIFLTAATAAFFIVPKDLVRERFDFIPEAAILGDAMPWKLGLDLVGGTALVYEIDLTGANPADYSDIVTSLTKVIERRVNPLGVLEPKITTAKKGDKYELMIELAGIKELKDAVKYIGETPTLDFREIKQEDDKIFISKTELTGRYIKSASLNFDQTTNSPLVDFELNDEGAKIFEAITERNIGKPICIFVDDNFIYADPKTGVDLGGSCPVVKDKIPGGRAQISGGNMNINSAKELIGRFKDGALGAPLKLINQRTVSSTIASDSLERMIFAGLIGTSLVMLFMIIYYRIFGVFASLALIIYALITLAIFKLLSVTMTLAGIAGFILSIGMAVDANILIFERTKEELKKGFAKVSAIEEGFKRAWPSIRDSNISTIITAVILFYFTSSFIKGFAFTLLVGVLMSMFSAIFVTRVLLRQFIKK